MSSQLNPTNFVITLAILALVVFRMSRPQKMTVWRFWILPAIVVVATVLFMYATLANHVPGVALYGGIASLVGLVLGIPLGIARGHHSNVRLGDRPGTFVVDPSIVVMLIWLGAFVVRFVVRMYIPNAGPAELGMTDGLFVFAVTSVLVARFVIFRKYQALAAAA
jgi:hypothetical protein